MDMEIVFDARQEAVESHLCMDERHEVLPDGEWIKAVQRLTGRDRLFVYHHKEIGSFVLAEWVYDDSDGIRVCIELEGMPHPPDLYQEGRPTMEDLRFRCKLADEMVKDMHEKIKKRRYQERLDREDGIAEKEDAIKRLKKLGLEDSARRVQSGADAFIPESMGGESFKQLKEEVTSMARSSSRIITHG